MTGSHGNDKICRNVIHGKIKSILNSENAHYHFVQNLSLPVSYLEA
jgi:hypothetical protein